MKRLHIFLTTSLLTSLAAIAQTAAPAAKVTPKGDDKVMVLDSVEVTGERPRPFSNASVDLPRTINDVQPYVVFDAQAINRSGAVDVQDFLRRNLTMDATRMTGAQGIAVTGVGSSFDLRGFGANHTLTLVNGRRAAGGNLLAASSIEQPNLNGIPLGAIERIEVLPTSGAAIYGGSAVGGVINVILKRNYSGGEVRTTYQNTFDSDATIRRIEANYGLSLEGGRTQVSLAAGWSETPTMTYAERPFLHDYELYRQGLEGGAAGVFTFTTYAPNIRSSPTTTLLTLKPAFGGGTLGSSATFVPLGTSPGTTPSALGVGLLANAGRQNLKLPTDSVQYRGGSRTDMGTTSQSRSLLASVRREMVANLELSAEFSFTRNDGERHLSSLQLLNVPASAPVNPFNQAVQVYLAMPFDRPTITASESRQATLGFILKLPRNWKSQGDYTWSGTRNAFSSWSSWAAQDQTDALNAGRLNPFVDAELYPVNLVPYIGDSRWSARGELHDIALRAAGPLWSLPAGEPTLALGLEWREESMQDGLRSIVYPSFPARDQHILFLGKTQATRSAYAELNVPLIGERMNIPLVRALDFQVAGRFEDYQVDTGTASVNLVPVPATPPVVLANQASYRSTQPTAGLRYQPVKGFALRTSYSGGFIPPTFAQLLDNPTPSATTTNINDPRRGNAATAVRTLSGGNPDLKPEIAKSWNVGGVFEPEFLPGARLSVDYYSIKKEDNIGTLTAQLMLQNENLFPERITRGPVPAGDSFGVGPVTLVDISAMNFLRARNEGFDVAFLYRKPTTSLGTLTFSANATVARHYLRQTALGAPYLDYVNFSGSGPLAFRTFGTLDWEIKQWTFGWSAYYYGRYKVLAPPVFASTAALVRQGGPFVSSQIYHNAYVSYRFGGGDAASRLRSLTRGLELQVGIENVFDHVPPYEGNSPNGFTYSTWGNLRLREYRLSLRKVF